MLNAKSFLAVDFGASNLKLAEFEVSEAGGLFLRQYALKPLGQEGIKEGGRDPALLQALQDMLAGHSFQSKSINVCAPGFNTFAKFVKLPPVDTSKVTQIIQYEAQQNVPFPLEEVVWDYQILGATPTGELEVLLVAIKTDVVEGLFKVVESAGLRIQLADVSPAALCNAFRYNYGDLEGCTMLLDIGAKTSNLIFFEGGNVYSRSINIGAQSITQDFAREAGLSFDDAEALKINEGFVSLGGAYEEPENPHQAAISKIARQVMTRLHIQVNQTVQYYRGQQGGSGPERLFLAGGASIMPYTAQFFAEKLNTPVEYFNPLRNVEIDPDLDREELVKVAHSLGEVVGLGLRNLAHCPVELNLMPASTLRRQQLGQKKPYFIAAFCSLLFILLAIGFFYNKVAAEKVQALRQLEEIVTPLKQNETTLNRVHGDLKKSQAELEQYQTWMGGRLYWPQLLTELRSVLLEVETQTEQEFRAKTGVWIENMVPYTEAGPVKIGYTKAVIAVGPGEWRPVATGPKKARPVSGLVAALGGGTPASTPAPAPPKPVATNAIVAIKLYCRGVDRTSVSPDANTKIAYALVGALHARADLVETNGTEFFDKILPDEDNVTFTFQVNVMLAQPFSL